jgi:hypothetical protein
MMDAMAIVGIGFGLFAGFGLVILVVAAAMDKHESEPTAEELEDFTRSMDRWGYVPEKIWRRGK